MTRPILEFQGEYRFLSNFWPSNFMWLDHIDYPTAEHAYQAAKSSNIGVRSFMAMLPTPGLAKRRGKQITIRKDWDKEKLDVMLDIVRTKFGHNPDLAQKLRDTGDAHLEEGNRWNDRFWGVSPVGSGQGQNRLGIILMQVREEIK